eukprot:SAG22_NODE_26_length_29806_cov_19.885381_12_plen_395_part_00
MAQAISAGVMRRLDSRAAADTELQSLMSNDDDADEASDVLAPLLDPAVGSATGSTAGIGSPGRRGGLQGRKLGYAGSSSMMMPSSSAHGGSTNMLPSASAASASAQPSSGSPARGLQGRKIEHAGSVSDTVLSWPASANANGAPGQQHGRAHYEDTPFLHRLRRAARRGFAAAAERAGELSSLSERLGPSLELLQQQLKDRLPAVMLSMQSRRDERATRISDARFAALSNMFNADVFCDGLYDLWEMQQESVEFCIPQLCAYFITQSPPGLRWPEEQQILQQKRQQQQQQQPGGGENGGDEPEAEGPSGGQTDGAEAMIPDEIEDDGSGPLPPDWTEHFDEETGCYFFYNERTDESSWVRPRSEIKQKLPTDGPTAAGAVPPSQYWYNARTDAS